MALVPIVKQSILTVNNFNVPFIEHITDRVEVKVSINYLNILLPVVCELWVMTMFTD